ncbi:DUF305 domain-containing protein [Longivirga aurantiaca]|uniref:DUF305 domain-containing protein n=1 Tax=Longivirga aurantiaca TaxID=1837743 RepID=A0ABW1T1U3_9ACTN
MRARLPLAATALALAAVLSGCSSHSSDMAGGTAAIVAGQQGDIAFAQLMIPHHEQAVEMADLALERETSPEVKALAEQIKGAQDPEIEQMTAWLAAWGAPTQMPGVEHSGDHAGMPGMMSDDDMSALADAQGAAFDEKWLTLMIAHHEGALTMAQQVLGTTTDAEVRTLAEAVVAGQKAEITEMTALLARA